MTEKPVAEACVRNQQPILETIEELFRDKYSILELGSGTGQHAVYFANAMPWLKWQTSDLLENHPGINMWLEEANLANTLPPIELDVTQTVWSEQLYDGVFSANTVHIMPWTAVPKLFEGIGRHLDKGGLFALYGPFKYEGKFTSESNQRFDLWLKERAEHQGIRDFEKLDDLAELNGLTFVNDVAMPSNNQILVWQK
ncbi:MAG: class I SAM-dependent methyltransferase [Kangiellaceae bacterium]|nr:class I SAM-dependent methyltransferase [Kangiellaceae bacterium]MCW8997844.1 class I SAM-dependent methyltransferase [Kangiellaceae bacterium]